MAEITIHLTGLEWWMLMAGFLAGYTISELRRLLP